MDCKQLADYFPKVSDATPEKIFASSQSSPLNGSNHSLMSMRFFLCEAEGLSPSVSQSALF
jgi:hypothetical protein